MRAADAVTDSFSVLRDSLGQPTLAVKKSALEKEFLLQSALMEQTVASMGRSLRSRIVVFKRRGAQVFLVEALEGHTVTEDLPQTLVLTRFPILSETPEYIELDFNKGMSSVLTNSEWTGHDFNGRDYEPSFDTTPTGAGYLEDIEVLPPSQIYIRQITQIPSISLTGESVMPIEVRYILEPYRPNPAFLSSDEADFKRAGFFELAPRLRKDGSTRITSTKFHAGAPIVFAISANTPAEYKQAMRDGVLYWKAALPSIEVIEAPPGVSAPHPQYNVVQWVNHDRVGMAYADAQMDPRTGEVRHAQVFITSVFAMSGRNKTRALLRRLEEEKPQPKAKTAHLPGVENGGLCNRSASREFARSLSALMSKQVSDDVILRVSQDFVRDVVAHEIGHVLGLRHNFAGSTEVKNYPYEKRQEIFDAYVRRDTVPQGLETASTVMDYATLEDSALHGQQMRTQTDSLYTYDRLAIRMLYQGADPDFKGAPVFCTDSDLDRYTDCRQHDAGRSIVEHAAAQLQHSKKIVPYQLVEKFIAAKAPAAWEKPRDVGTVNLNPSSVASAILEPGSELMATLASKKHSLHVVRTFPFVGPLNEDQVVEEEMRELEEEVQRLGGWEALFPAHESKDFESIFDEMDRLVRDPRYTTGEGLNGQPYFISTEESETILNRTLDLVSKLPDAVSKADVAIFKQTPDRWKISGTKTGDALTALFAKRSNQYILTTTGKTISVDMMVEPPAAAAAALAALTLSHSKPTDYGQILKSNLGGIPSNGLAIITKDPLSLATTAPTTPAKVAKHVELPVFQFSQEVREAAAGLMKVGSHPDGIDWSFAERAKLKADLKAAIEKGCGCELDKFSVEKATIANVEQKRRLTRWFLENKKVLSLIP